MVFRDGADENGSKVLVKIRRQPSALPVGHGHGPVNE
jgi:hypothetical protein